MPQSFTSLHYHIVFSTKKRQPAIVDDFQGCAAFFLYQGLTPLAIDCRPAGASGI